MTKRFLLFKTLAAATAYMLLLLLPVVAVAQVEIGIPGDFSDGGGNLAGTQVYFGSYTGGASTGPIKWYVVATDNAAGTATLWTTTSMGDRPYGSDNTHHNWNESEIELWLNGKSHVRRPDFDFTATGFLPNAFSALEQGGITAYGTTEDGIHVSNINISQKIVLPSVAEMGNGNATGDWGVDVNFRAFGDWWWLRSPGGDVSYAAIAIHDGRVSGTGYDVDNQAAVRPAFKLNLASVIFTSSVSTNPKSDATVGAGLNPAAAPVATDAVKLTVLDAAMARPNLAITSGNGTGSINFSYTGAETGTNQVLSATLVQGGDIKYYGKLANTATSADGSFVLSFAGVANGTYTLNVFSEQANSDNASDFAGAAVSMTLTVSGNTGTIQTRTITFNLDGGTQEAGDWGSYVEGIGRDLPTTPTRNGYAFDGWYANIGLMGAPVLAISATDTGDKTFWAKWLSSDAGLVNIFGQVLTLGNEAGTVGAPITANMAVANNVASIAGGNISAATGAMVELFSDAGFATLQGSINLTAGASTTVYIRVTAADGVTMLYYAVTIARAANPLAGGTTASIPALGPVGLGLLVLMLGLSGIRGQRSGIRKT